MRIFFAWLTILFLLMGALPAFSAQDAPGAQNEKSLSQDALETPAQSAADGEPKSLKGAQEKTANFEEEYVEEGDADEKTQGERVAIADPLEPFNRAMYLFNDRLYFWLLKPAAQGYNVVVPEPARISIKNFFTHLAYPSRLLSLLLQADFAGAAEETGRFVINTLWGIGGLLDPAAGGELKLQRQEADLGQTLGVYGVGHGFYIVWPIWGPSSPRDTLTIVGDTFLYPPSYISPWYVNRGVWAFEKINSASLRIGDYESLISAAIDPYLAIRDAYAQYRAKDINARKTRSLLFKDHEDPTPKPGDGQKDDFLRH